MYWLIDNFYELRQFCGDDESPISPRLLMDWAEMHGKDMPAWERSAYVQLDRALRDGRNAAIMHHMKRDKKLQESKKKHRAKNR